MFYLAYNKTKNEPLEMFYSYYNECKNDLLKCLKNGEEGEVIYCEYWDCDTYEWREIKRRYFIKKGNKLTEMRYQELGGEI